jgi:hypothetical protein
MTEVLDCSYDEDGNISQFLILENGQPETKLASPENLLLYDPEEELPFDGGMSEFLSGGAAIRLSDEPPVLVSRAGDDYSYIIRVRESLVETTPNQAERVLRAIYDALADDDTSSLESLHQRIMSNQVRRPVVNAIKHTFPEDERIDIAANGWLVDGFYLVDWNACLYAANDNPEEDDYIRSGGTVKKDTTYEFVRINHRISQEDEVRISIGDTTYELTEREMLFLAKVKWLLHRRHYHPDKPFWMFADRWSDVDVETGEPPEDMEPNLDQFDI